MADPVTALPSYSRTLPLPVLAVLHARPGFTPKLEELRLLIAGAYAEDCDPVLVMAEGTLRAMAANVRDELGYPTAPDITSCYGTPIKLDDAVHPGTVIAYRSEEFAIIRRIRQEHPEAAVYPSPPAEEDRRG